MAQQSLAAIGQRLRQWVGRQTAVDGTDELLLRRFTADRDEGAFAALMRRHGPLVLGVCRRVLADGNDVDDAFQATFLVLARKAGSIAQGEALGGWLARVACRLAVTARAAAARRRDHERQAHAMKPPAATAASWDDLQPVLDEEVDRLPRKYRLPVVLCYLEGRSHDEAARQLGWPKGTVAGRLARARALLHQRLSRRGVTLSAAGLATLLAAPLATAAVPASLFNATLHTALADSATHLAAASHAAALAEEFMHTMFLTKVKLTAAGVAVAVGLLGLGAGAYYQAGQAAQLPGRVQRAPLPGPGGANEVQPAGGEHFAAFNQAELLFTAKVASAVLGPVGLSEPPLYSVTLTFEDVKMLRGRPPAALTFNYSVRSRQQPVFNQGDAMLVAAAAQRITTIVPATAGAVAQARQAVSVPIGWTLVNDRPVSPWAARGERAKLPGLAAAVVCAKSGRPALLAGPVELQVEKVLPAQVHKFKNPFGDGEFKITVTNPGKEAIKVPALLTDGKDVRWADSLVILQNGKPHLLPAGGQLPGPLQSVRLPPGGSVTGTINTLRLRDVAWPRGGSRVQFQFCLGERAASDFFYYFSDLHDKLRAAAAK